MDGFKLIIKKAVCLNSSNTIVLIRIEGGWISIWLPFLME